MKFKRFEYLIANLMSQIPVLISFTSQIDDCRLSSFKSCSIINDSIIDMTMQRFGYYQKLWTFYIIL